VADDKSKAKPAGQPPTSEDERRDLGLLGQVLPQDLIRHGFIPEFVGRLPVNAVLSDLDQKALVEILHRPKNSLVRQYQKLFEFENIKLSFEPDALQAIATLSLERKVGARGLRMILEELMLDLMYYLPSKKRVREFVVNKQMVEDHNLSLNVLDKAG
jgi:ATP-dependent Clp protease ATP-binding subunit ClpX